MLKRIISNGQTGVDLAALDAAVKLDLMPGGYTPENKGNERAPLRKFNLQEISGTRRQCAERNILDSDGTLIFFRRSLGGSAAFCRNFARQHHRPWLHIDLNVSGKFDAALKIGTWIMAEHIAVLHVTGAAATMVENDPGDIRGILESAYHLCLINHVPHDTVPVAARGVFNIPQTVEEAVNLLDSYMSLKDKVTVANFTADELLTLHQSLGSYINNSFRLWLDNDALLESCRIKTMKSTKPSPDDASTIIIYELWKALRKTHRLRVIKGGLNDLENPPKEE